MNRREWVKAATLAGAAAACEPYASSAVAYMEGDRSQLQTSITRLKLRHTWTTTMSSSEYRDTLSLRLTSQGVTGTGEGAPINRYNETAEGAHDAVESLRAWLV